MSLHTLPKLTRQKKRRGRGIGSRGAKSGRGMKGQRSRAGSHRKAGFEGGQTPLYMRLPKGRGQKHRIIGIRKKPTIITFAQMNHFDEGSIVGPGQLHKAGLVIHRQDKVKLVNTGALKKKLTLRVHGVSVKAREVVETLGGHIDIIP